MTGLNRYLFKLFSAIISFGRVSGVAFVGGCAALAISRVCQVLAFFLPLKIFIVIYSGEVPDYINILPNDFEFDRIVIALSSLVPLTYLLFILLGIIYRWAIDAHLRKFGDGAIFVCGITVSGKKVRRLHNHVSKAFSEAGLILVSLFFILLLDPAVGLALAVLLYLNLWLFNTKAFSAEDHDRITFLKLHRRQFIDYVASANFLVVFAFLAMQLIFFGMGIYIAIFLLLISRMTFQSLNRFSVESLFILKLLPSSGGSK